jgi:ribosome-binding protein aMBF1 (putative translation factor)
MGRGTLRLSHFFAAVVQRHREAKGLSRQGLTERAGLHQTAVGLIERGLRTPNIDTLEALGRSLQIKASRLIQEAEAEMLKKLSDAAPKRGPAKTLLRQPRSPSKR